MLVILRTLKLSSAVVAVGVDRERQTADRDICLNKEALYQQAHHPRR